VDACCVEGSTGETRGCVDHAQSHEVVVAGDDDVEGCVVVLVLY
jgi:hypothetical protein